MDEKQPTVTSVALKYGLVGGLFVVLYTTILMVMDMSTNKLFGALTYLILLAILFVAMKQFKKENFGYMSFGQGLGIGTLVSAIIGIVSGVFVVIYTTFIDPDHFNKIFEEQRMELEDRGMSDAQIDTALSIGQSLQGPFMTIVMSIVGYAFIGFLVSLIISAIMKKNRPEFE